jgi:DNA-directed RNA polymerase subunit RPC12/RpoP
MDVPASQKQAQVVTDIENVENEYKCLECGKIFSKYQTFYQHKKIHKKIIYRCVQCPSTYKTKQGIHYHSRTVHELRKFECHYCQSTFNAKFTLQIHMTMHSKSKHVVLHHRSLICPKSNVNNLNCMDVPASQKQAPIVTDVNNVENEYKCLECGKIFSNYKKIYHHKKVHEGIIYRCVECLSTYKSISSLNNHLKTQHELRKFECHYCQSTFNAKFSLKRHMTMRCPRSNVNNLNCLDVPAPQKQAQVVTDIENVENEYKCLECGKIFLNYQTFYKHKKKHEGIIYRCVQCPSTYTTIAGLKYHSKTVHELWKFECHYCQSTFKAKFTLQMHMSMHCPRSNVNNLNYTDVPAPQ